MDPSPRPQSNEVVDNAMQALASVSCPGQVGNETDAVADVARYVLEGWVIEEWIKVLCVIVSSLGEFWATAISRKFCFLVTTEVLQVSAVS